MVDWSYGPGGSAYPVQPEQTWAVGPHRIMCADVETGAALQFYKTVPERPQLILTDPPWNAGVAKGFRTKSGVGGEADFENLMTHLEVVLRAHDRVACVEMGFQCKEQTREMLINAGYHSVEETQIPYGKSFSYFLSGVKEADPGKWDVQPKEHTSYRCAIPRWTQEGDAVFDMFCGLGLILAEAARQGRVAYGLELHPARCSRSLVELAKITGLEPKLLES